MATILTSGSLTLRLPSPDFEDSETIESDRISRKSRGGDLTIFRDPTWTSAELIRVRFSYMDQGKIAQLLHFIKVTLGQNVTMTSHDGRHWVGVILNPASDVSQPGRQNFVAGFDFQGSET